LVKEGSEVRNYKATDSDPDIIRVMVKVYFPEIDDEGNIDPGNWCLTEEEAEFKEKWYKFNRKLHSEYDKLEKRKKEFWKLASEDLDLLEELDISA
jgi:hypothetical protein